MIEEDTVQRTRPFFETLAMLAPQDEALVLRSAQSGLEAQARRRASQAE
jgi:hypothetical protein